MSLKDFAIFVAVGAGIFGFVHNNTVVVTTWLRQAGVKLWRWITTHLKRVDTSVPIIPLPAPDPVPVPVPAPVPVDPFSPTELTPAAALALGDPAVQNTHFYGYLRSLTPNALAEWLTAYLTLAAQMFATGPGGASATVNNPADGKAYVIPTNAQATLDSLANNSGAKFLFS